MKIHALLFLLAFSGAALPASAQLKVARLFGEHLVLQRGKPLPIWGESTAGDKIQVLLNGQQASAVAGADGRWRAELPAMPAGGPYTLTIKNRTNLITIPDVLIGEVWLCSGQSNMEWRVRQADNANAEIANAKYPQIRHFEVPHEMDFSPRKDLNGGDWKVCTPENAGEFTAVGYYFAREIAQRLGVPVGLIHSSWGGSQVESWISEAAMASSDVLNYYPAIMARTWEEDARRWEKKLIQKVYGTPDYATAAVDETTYLTGACDYSKWLTIRPNGQWDWQGIWAFRGGAYIQRTVDIPPGYATASTQLRFGRNTSDLGVYINGKRVFEGYHKDGVSIDLPPGSWKAGANSLLIQLGPMRDPAWFGMGFMGAPNDFFIKLDEKHSVPLVDTPWNMMPSWKSERHYIPWMNNEGTILYNAMIAPLAPYAIAGALWYQGESNASRAEQYRQSFPLMIRQWRQDWNDEFPFFFVQLSSFGPSQSSNEGSTWAELREAQTMTLQLPKTGMAVSIDIGNPDDIHPTNKQEVGRRLALQALKTAYGQNVVYNGPEFQTAAFLPGKAEISFLTGAESLTVKDKYGYLKGFEIAGADRKFYYATAIVDGNKVIVQHPAVPEPKAVRYGWANSPIDCNLYNNAGLPAAPFRTDQWDGLTKGVRFE